MKTISESILNVFEVDSYSKEEIAKAKEFGAQAFKAGKKLNPSQDKNLMNMMGAKKGPMGSSIKLMKAWHSGWNTENLKKENFSESDSLITGIVDMITSQTATRKQFVMNWMKKHKLDNADKAIDLMAKYASTKKWKELAVLMLNDKAPKL